MTLAVTRVLRCVAIVSLVMVAACGSPTSSGDDLVGDKSTKVVHYRSCSLIPNEMNWVGFDSCS